MILGNFVKKINDPYISVVGLKELAIFRPLIQINQIKLSYYEKTTILFSLTFGGAKF
jgi:hypothetical protein